MQNRFRKVPWKRNFQKVPTAVQNALSEITSELVIVAATKAIPLSDVEAGLYSHLGVRLVQGKLEVQPAVLPPGDMGKYSYNNLHGWEVVRDDLPKIIKSFVWETPNFGDASRYGSHMHFQDREVFQRQYFQAKNLHLTVEVLKAPVDGAKDTLLKFAVDTVLDRKRADFDDDLLFCLNLLQENTGATGVYASTATRQDFARTIMLDWEVFPPGTADEVVAAFSKGRAGKPQMDRALKGRIELFSKLKPEAYLRGTGSFGSYIGAKFGDDLVVFENLSYGNALYVLYEDWKEISQRPRLDLLKGTNENYDRFPHTPGWEARFMAHMMHKQSGRKRKITYRRRYK